MSGGSSTDTPRSTEEVAAVLNRVIARVGDSTSGVDWYERLLAALDAKDAEIQRLREALERAHLARIEAQNPGIDIAEVQRRAALSRSDTPGEPTDG